MSRQPHQGAPPPCAGQQLVPAQQDAQQSGSRLLSASAAPPGRRTPCRQVQGQRGCSSSSQARFATRTPAHAAAILGAARRPAPAWERGLWSVRGECWAGSTRACSSRSRSSTASTSPATAALNSCRAALGVAHRVSGDRRRDQSALCKEVCALDVHLCSRVWPALLRLCFLTRLAAGVEEAVWESLRRHRWESLCHALLLRGRRDLFRRC
jgi:hypothetical protein